MADVSSGASQIQGEEAHDSPVVGFPVRTGGRASAAAPADVSTDGDVVNAWYLRNGAQAVVITANGVLIGSNAAVAGNGALTETGVLAAGIGPGFDHRVNPANLGTAVNSASAVDTNGAATVGIQLNTTTTGTIAFEGTNDGVTWLALTVAQLSGAENWLTLLQVGSTIGPTVGNHYVVACAGFRQVRLRTASTLGATVAHVFTLSLSDLISYPRVSGIARHDDTLGTITAPVSIGGQMETMADSAPLTRAGTDGDSNKLATTDGALFVIPTGPQAWSYHENSSSALTDASVHAAPGAGLSLYVTTIIVSTGAATALNVFFEEGATTVLGPYYLEAVAGRGLALTFQTPKKITANTALTITTSAAIAHGIDVTGFIAPG